MASSSFAELAAKCRAAARAIEDAAPVAVNHGAFVVKRTLLDAVEARVGSDLKFSAKVPVNVRYRLGGTGPVRTARLYPLGPVHWLEGTRAHDIEGRERTGKRKRLKFDDGEIRSQVRHPGTKPTRTWRTAADRAAQPAAEAMRDEYVAAVREVFEG